MNALVIGSFERAAELAESLRAEGVEAKIAEPAGGSGSEISLLARELIHLEALLDEDRPDAVVLADAGDRALVGVLAATKLVVPIAAAEESVGPNRDLIAQLADRIVPADGGGLAAWIAAAPKLPRP